MKSYFVSVVLALSSILSVQAEERVEIPSDSILEAAMEIFPKTGPGYQVEGTLECQIFEGTTPSGRPNPHCRIYVEGNTGLEIRDLAFGGDSDAIVEALDEYKAPNAAGYLIHTPFVATSISQEIPPYETVNRAEAIIGQ
jgi:hypothetical protein